MDLFAPVVPTTRQHIYFRELTSGKHPEKDGKFVLEFQTTFNSSFWELCLRQAFIALRMQVDTSAARPDFLLTTRAGHEFVAEATTASNATGYVPQWQPTFSKLPPLEAMLEYQSIRLANAVIGKTRKYRDSYTQLPHVGGKPFVICVAPFEQQGSHSLGDRAMRRVLFGVDVPLLDRDSNGDPMIVGQAHAERAWKESGAEVPFGVFRDGKAAEVSAVLFGPLATFGKLTMIAGSSAAATYVQALRYDKDGLSPTFYGGEANRFSETLLDGLHLFVNPFAAVPLDLTAFAGSDVAIHQFDPRTLTLVSSVPHGFLIARQTYSVFARGSVVRPKPPDSALKRPAITPLPDGVLHRLGGGVGFTTDTHVAHHRNWTILVARDTVDNDWGAIARPDLFRSADAFREANRADDSKTLLSFDFMPTKELALSTMVKQIDNVLDKT
jgi:hypothetical protein